MSLRVKLLLVVALMTTGLLATLLVLTRLVLVDSYARLEQSDTAEHVARARNALNNELATLARTANDYAAWDDTYDFMATRNQAYLDANYPDPTFTNNRLSLVTLVDTDGQIVFAKAFDLETEQAQALSAEMTERVVRDPLLLLPARSVSSTIGVMAMSGGVMLVAVRPILTSDESGPTRGALLMGRTLSISEIRHLGEVTELALAVHLPDETLLPQVQAAVSALSPDNAVVVQPISEDMVQGYTWVYDITQQPALLLRVDRPREIYRQGQATLSYFALMVIASGLVIGTVLAGLLERLVVLRLGRLNAEVHAIGVQGGLDQRVTSHGRDELGQLAVEINRMLASLEQAERLLSQRERESLTLLDSIPAYAFFKDAAGHYVVANQRFCEALKHTREEVTGKTDYDFYPRERAERYRADDVYVMEHGQIHEVSEETIGQGANAVVLATKKVPLTDGRGQVIGLIGLAFDITERKHIMQELAVARDQAVAALKFKSQLLANVSHDLRTPISAILGFAEMLQAGVYGPLQNQQGEPLTRIIINSQHLGRMVADLLDQSRLDSGKLILRSTPFTPADLLEAIRASASLTAREKGLTLITLAEPDAPTAMVGDYERVLQIVTNLVDNAIRFTAEGSVTIQISGGDITRYRIRVSDTGGGIAPDEQAHIFEAFKQGRTQAPGRYRGLGLGLSIVKQLVTLMGGQVTLNSEIGHGSTFTVVLPLDARTKDNS